MATGTAPEIDWDLLRPGKEARLDWDRKVPIPKEIVEAYSTIRGLGRAVSSRYNGQYVVRTDDDGIAYMIPVKDMEAGE